MLQRLQLPHLQAEGYVNLRCAWILGCPSEMTPQIPSSPSVSSKTFRIPAAAANSHAVIETAYGLAFAELFPNTPVPPTVAVSCCAQFALTRAKVLERPRADYERYRRWLLDSRWPDDVTGRILEYMWHSMFSP